MPKCALCDNEITHEGVCRECILIGRENWLEHYWNHDQTNQPRKDCKFCPQVSRIT